MGSKYLISLALLGLVGAAKVQQKAETELTSLQEKDGRETDREGKFLSVFQIIKFKNEMCPASNGDMGTCYTEAECTAKGGMGSGSCATGFGVCCVFKVTECDTTISEDNTYIESPGYPGSAPVGMCMYNLAKCEPGICQYKITFEDFVISSPAMGECNNDTLMFSGFDDPYNLIVPEKLCGDLTGHTIYVGVEDVTDPPKMTINIVESGMDKRWRIKVDQIACTETDNLAPHGCLKYHTEEKGTLESFNFNGGNGELINTQCYTECLKPINGFCNVELMANDFDLGPGDNICFSTNCQTGSNFGDMGMLMWNYTGPYTVPVKSNDMNTAMNLGYSIDYMFLPC